MSKAVSPYAYEPESGGGAGATMPMTVINALGEMVQELSYNLRNQPVILKDTLGNRTEYSYGLDGKVKDIRRSGNGNWNGSTGEGSESGGVKAQNAASLPATANAPFSSMSIMQEDRLSE